LRTETPINSAEATRRQRGSFTLGACQLTAHKTDTGMIEALIPQERSRFNLAFESHTRSPHWQF
jgi:hypothetical protein